MKRLTFLLLLLVIVSAAAFGGVRTHLDSGLISGSANALGDLGAGAEGQSDDEMVFSVAGGGASSEALLTAVLTLSQNIVETSEAVTLDASASQAGEGEIILYEWDLNGDGVFDESSVESMLTHAFDDDGVTFVQARITDDQGESALSEVLFLVVVNQQPVARFAADFKSNAEGSLVQFVDSSMDKDGTITTWAWDFGDGYTSNEPSPSHIYNTGGTFFVTLSVTDDDGMRSAPYMFEIEIVNSAPQAEFSLQQSMATAGSPLTFVDESFDSSSNGTIVHVAWDFGDGSYQVGGPSSNSEYSHTFAAAGTYMVTLYVIDNDGALGLVQLPITVL